MRENDPKLMSDPMTRKDMQEKNTNFLNPTDEFKAAKIVKMITDHFRVEGCDVIQSELDDTTLGMYMYFASKKRGRIYVKDLTDIRLAIHEVAHHIHEIMYPHHYDIHGTGFHLALKRIVNMLNKKFNLSLKTSMFPAYA